MSDPSTTTAVAAPAAEPNKETSVTPAPRRSSWEAIGPTWRWIAGLAVSALGVLFVWWMTTLATNVGDIAHATQTQAELQTRALAAQAERIASVESWRQGTDGRLERIDKSLDKIETKLDRALEKR